MQVPLSVESIEENGKEKLSFWANGKNIVIDAPIKPYFYSLEKLNIPAKMTKVEGIRISDYQKKTFYKYEFNTRKELRNRIDSPNLYTKYAHTNVLKFNFLDIEQYCPKDKLFPTYDDRISSLSFSEDGEKIKTVFLKEENPSDKKLLEVYKANYPFPDIEVLYNKGYDLPTIFERCKRNGLDINWFSKKLNEPYVGGKHGIRIDGTVIYDVLDSTRKDQSLTGNVPNKGLKVVSDYFGFKSTAKVLVGDEITQAIGSRELVEYNKEDVRRLFFLFNIYWEGIEYTANDLKIPLSEAVDISVTDLGIIVLGDLYREHGIICDGDNSTRYPEIFERHKKPGEPNYQGALVYIKQRGLFTPVLKADYSSMYPTIASEFNFSPDTCTILRYEPYKKKGFKIEEDKDTFTYYIPDNALKKIVVVQTLKKKGFLSKAIRKFLDERDQYKKEWKETGSKIARARSDIAKVKANGGIYGNMGSPRSPFGFAPVAVATTGIGRQCAKLLIDVLETLYPNSVIEVDTDGVYFTAEDYNEERIIHYFNEALREKFKKELDLTIDVDIYERGYFHKAKNYILKKGNNIILHGAAMKASSKDNISKNLINELADAKVNDKPTDGIIQKYKALDFPLRDFAMQVTMGRHIYEYKNQNCISVNIANQAFHHFKIKPQIGNNYFYVKCREGYRLYQLVKKEDIDIKYYSKKVDKILKMFESEYEVTKKVGQFLDDEEETEWEGDIEEVKVEEKKPMSLEDFL